MKKLLFSIAMLLVAHKALAIEDGQEWLNAPPGYDHSAEPLAAEHMHEVVTSKFLNASYSLAKSRFLLLEDYAVQSFTGHPFKCTTGRRPYLVRAVYGHGSGNYEVRRIGTAIWVRHGSLGRTTVYNKSALVLCLDFEPSEVFNTVSIAQ